MGIFWMLVTYNANSRSGLGQYGPTHAHPRLIAPSEDNSVSLDRQTTKVERRTVTYVVVVCAAHQQLFRRATLSNPTN